MNFNQKDLSVWSQSFDWLIFKKLYFIFNSLFVTLGVPGTGKTATVKQVMRYMDENRDDFPEFEFYELNGMRLTCPEQIYVEERVTHAW